jgi:hypothetical protein
MLVVSRLPALRAYEMKQRMIQSVEDLLSIVQEYANTNVIYRGVGIAVPGL